MDREAWRAIVHGIAKELDTTEQLKQNNNKNDASSHYRTFSL